MKMFLPLSCVIASAAGAGFVIDQVFPDQQIQVFDAARGFVLSQQVAPSTARFCTIIEARFSEKDGKHQVNLWLDAQNGYGAMLRQHWSVLVNLNDRSIANAVWVEREQLKLALEKEKELLELQRQTEEIRRLTRETVDMINRRP